MKRLLYPLALGLALAGGTSANAVHVIPPNQLPPALYGKPQASKARTQQVVVYFIRGNRLTQQTRTLSSSLTSAQQAMRELLKGPTAEEITDGLSTAIPSDTALLSVDVDNNRVANVNLSLEFGRATDIGNREFRLAQVVYTLTELPDIDAVRFRIEGDPEVVIDDNNVPTSLVSRAKYSRFAPMEAPTHVDPCSLVDSLGQCQPTSTATGPTPSGP